MHYIPVLPDGSIVSLPWQIKTFYYNLGWPLQDNAKLWIKFLYYLNIFLGISIFVFVGEAELRYIFANLSDISLSVEALVTNFILNELFLRIVNVTINQIAFKAFLEQFYRNIYIDEKENPKIWKSIRRGLLPCTVYTYFYISTLAAFLVTPFLKLRKHEKSLPYKMILHYNYDHPMVHWFTLGYLAWIGYCIIFFIIGEAFLLATCILHLNARYELAQQEMREFGSDLLDKVPRSQLALEFRKAIIGMFVKMCDLNRFTVLLNNTFKFRIFIMFAFSAGFLCILCFQVASLGASTENVKYASWIIAKVMELLIFGTLGSTIIQITDNTSSMYYLSNWEEIIYRSTNQKENILLLKDLQTIMSLHRNSLRLSGFNYFDVSLDTVIKVLRGAFSFFTCLYNVKERN